MTDARHSMKQVQLKDVQENFEQIFEDVLVSGEPVIVLSSNNALNEKTQSNAAEVATRGARLIEVGCEVAADQLKLPSAPNLLEPFLQAMAMQMISYFAALTKGTDLDQPKNLAKSVTVE